LKELRTASQQSGFIELPPLGAHAELLSSQPRHHNDPFDQVIVSQAIAEPMQLITFVILINGDANLSSSLSSPVSFFERRLLKDRP
jgi:hypothetical protein